jgi:hypothetical protein
MRVADRQTGPIGITEKGDLVLVSIESGVAARFMTVGIVVVVRNQEERVRMGNKAASSAFRRNI